MSLNSSVIFEQLWADHFWWTSRVIRDAVLNSLHVVAMDTFLAEDLEYLYDNQKELGAAFGSLSGNSIAGTKLTALLTQHIDQAVAIVVALIGNINADITDLNNEWKKNARAIACLIHRTINAVPYEELKQIFYIHLEHVADEAFFTINAMQGRDAAVNAAKAVDATEDGLAHVRTIAEFITSRV